MNKIYGLPHYLEEFYFDFAGRQVKLTRKDMNEIRDLLIKASKVEPFYFENDIMYKTEEYLKWQNTEKGKKFGDMIKKVYRERLN